MGESTDMTEETNLSTHINENMLNSFVKQNITRSSVKMKETFDKFDQDEDGFLDEIEFSNLLQHLFTHGEKPYPMNRNELDSIMKLLDENQDGKIDYNEFGVCWYHWFKQILDPVSALIIVDVQNDFISGTLAIRNCPAGQDGVAVVPIINKLLDECDFDVVVYSSDWHPQDHISFIENVCCRKIHPTSKMSADKAVKYDTVVFDASQCITEQKLWPAHCVQKTWGAEPHPDLKVVKDAIHVYKGTNPDIDSYSAFWDNHKLSQTNLVSELTRRRVTDVYVCGLAYDVCVGSTALHSMEHGFRTVLVEDACRGVDLTDIDNMRQKLKRQGAVIVQSSAVKDMAAAVDRRPELGYQAALNVAMAKQLLKEEAKKILIAASE